MTIAELNTKAIVKHYTSSKDADGNVISTLTASWEKWAKVTQKSGSRSLDNATITYKEVYEVMMRRETNRQTLTDYKLDWNEKEMTIHSVVIENIGNAWWEKLTCFIQS